MIVPLEELESALKELRTNPNLIKVFVSTRDFQAGDPGEVGGADEDQGIDHVSINVKDIAASAEFYGEVLGFRELADRAVRRGFIDHVLRDPRRRAAGAVRLRREEPARAREESEAGLRHLAFEVDDVDDAEKRLRGRG